MKGNEHNQQSRRYNEGFTLIEVVLGLALLALLIGGVFAVARGSLKVASEVTENQQYSMKIHSYLELLRRTFEGMPGNGQVLLRPLDARGSESEIAFIEYPLAFAWSGIPAGSKAIVLRTVTTPNGWLESRIFYLDEEQSAEYINDKRLDESAPNLMIMDQMKMLQWRVYDQRNEEWVTEWDEQTARPSLIELNVQFLDGSNPVAVVFWIPTVVNPEEVVRAANTGAPGAGGGGAGPGGGQGEGGQGGPGADGGGGPGGGRGGQPGQGGGRGGQGGGGRGNGGGGGRGPGGGGGGGGGGVPGVPGAGGGR
ncbi:MAG: prepilin-type N-terminal cleavage/methylation domain-containing protein [Verrucomicrobia bacterium]|nr:prepilin-type N-terminal cleavage/methylation domain-containing protein [Verrucomicrobiota bacterium]